MLKLYTLDLINREIKALEEKLTLPGEDLDEKYKENLRIIINQYKREKIILEKLQVNFNITGSLEEFAERLKDVNLYLLSETLFNNMSRCTLACSHIIEELVRNKLVSKPNDEDQKGESGTLY